MTVRRLVSTKKSGSRTADSRVKSAKGPARSRLVLVLGWSLYNIDHLFLLLLIWITGANLAPPYSVGISC